MEQTDRLTSTEIIDIRNDVKRHPDKEFPSRTLNTIENLIVHHTATKDTETGDVLAKKYAKGHVDNNGWPSIGYHFLIDKDGRIYQTNSIDKITWHAKRGNTKGIGVALVGNFEKEEVNEEQFQALERLIKYLSDVRFLNLNIKGHRDFMSTACPGDNLYKRLGELKVEQDINAKETYKNFYEKWVNVLNEFLSNEDDDEINEIMEIYFGDEWKKFVKERSDTHPDFRELAKSFFTMHLNKVRDFMRELGWE